MNQQSDEQEATEAEAALRASIERAKELIAEAKHNLEPAEPIEAKLVPPAV